MEKILRVGRILIPQPIFEFFQPAYHFMMAWFAALWYGFPSRKLTVIGVTGTKGKSTVVYLTARIFEEAGEPVAAVGSLGYKINEREWPNTSENTMPGRFRLPRFFYDAKRVGVRYVVLEVTSEGIKQFRHLGIHFDCAVFTNLEPEHIERHGSFENYYEAKQKLFARTKNIHILNKVDPRVDLFSKFPARTKIFFHPEQARHYLHNFLGDFNQFNVSAAIAVVRAYGVEEIAVRSALEKIKPPPGRLEEIKTSRGFRVFVDYAHTPNSLRSVYEALRSEESRIKNQESRLICVLGAAGGNRDKWKRPKFGRIAGECCDEIILTNEDPYDENPATILEEIVSGFSSESRIKNKESSK